MWEKCHQGTAWNFVISRARPGREDPLVARPVPSLGALSCAAGSTATGHQRKQPMGPRELVRQKCERLNRSFNQEPGSSSGGVP